MLRKTILAIAVLAVLLAVVAGTALGTPPNGVSAETARGPLVDRPLAVNWHFAAGSKIKLQSQGPMEQAVQRIVAVPGATFGWHSHPGPSLVIVKTGTATFYDADDPACAPHVVPAGAGFVDNGQDTHVVRNEGSVDLITEVVSLVPTGFARRIDEDAPANCPALRNG